MSKITQDNEILVVVPNHASLEKLIIVLFNNFGLKCYGISNDVKDTVFSYQVKTDQKIKISKLKEIKSFCQGFVLGINYIY